MQNLLSQSSTELSPTWTVTTVPAAASVPPGRDWVMAYTLPELADVVRVSFMMRPALVTALLAAEAGPTETLTRGEAAQPLCAALDLLDSRDTGWF